jgi:hypothetical protein
MALRQKVTLTFSLPIYFFLGFGWRYIPAVYAFNPFFLCLLSFVRAHGEWNMIRAGQKTNPAKMLFNRVFLCPLSFFPKRKWA